ncbi:hypothetical protein AS593_05230 [Caulobacter vibrioides]|nr:hypothetical protein AS593_05230 [Caulobacter vibrioides]
MAWTLFGFGGRLSRRDYWRWGLPAFACLIVVNLLIPVGTVPGEGAWNLQAFVRLMLSAPLIWVLYALALKRCHDRGKGRGWLLLFLIVPLAGWMWSLVELGFLPGQTGSNRFGPSPHGEETLDEIFA